MSYTYKSLLLFPLIAGALLFSTTSNANGSGSDLILTHANAANMSMECLMMARHNKIDTPEVRDCYQTCRNFRRSYVNAKDFDARLQQSKSCRSAYSDATGKDIVPTLPKNYVSPKKSARNPNNR